MHVLGSLLVVVAAVGFLSLPTCHRSDTSGAAASESCAITDDGGVLDVGKRTDGIYGVVDDRLGDEPLSRFDRLAKTGEGIDTQSGKRWIRIRLAHEETEALRRFTETPTNKRMAVVIGREIASTHKVKAAITSDELQVSCCNPRACDRWNAILDQRP